MPQAEAEFDFAAHKVVDGAVGWLDHLAGVYAAMAEHKCNQATDGHNQQPAVDLLHRLQHGLLLHRAVELSEGDVMNRLIDVIHPFAEPHPIAGDGDGE